MSKWTYKIDFSEFITNDNIGIEDKGERLSNMLYDFIKQFTGDNYQKQQLREISDYFSVVETEEEFDDYMEQLYDWADDNSLCIKSH